MGGEKDTGKIRNFSNCYLHRKIYQLESSPASNAFLRLAVIEGKLLKNFLPSYRCRTTIVSSNLFFFTPVTWTLLPTILLKSAIPPFLMIKLTRGKLMYL